MYGIGRECSRMGPHICTPLRAHIRVRSRAGGCGRAQQRVCLWRELSGLFWGSSRGWCGTGNRELRRSSFHISVDDIVHTARGGFETMWEGGPRGKALCRLAFGLRVPAFGVPLSGWAQGKRRDQEVRPMCLLTWHVDGRCGTTRGSFHGGVVRRGNWGRVIGRDRHLPRSAKGTSLASGRGERDRWHGLIWERLRTGERLH